MAHGSCDYEASGGLMPMIRALVKPPDELMNPPKPKKPQHPYYKRPGKGHNRDCCDACNEGGDLICCDRCPASFHLTCYDPPLELEDIPVGMWLCKACGASDAASDENSRASSPIRTSRRGRQRGGKASAKKRAEAKRLEARQESLRRMEARRKAKEAALQRQVTDVDAAQKDINKELSPMELLVQAARIMNPKQFELPREMKIPILFPGTNKGKKNKPRKGSGDVWGNNIPLPGRECFMCRGNTKKAPLIQCDYCPLLFHQDCLDPPLTALPIGRWMCPNHVEQFIDWKMVNSISATERVALWDKFGGPVDQHAIKVDFLRRARRNNPPFRIKVPAPERGRVIVPPMVCQHYDNPPPLLPSRREFVRCAKVLKNLKAAGGYDESEEEGDMTEETKHKICMNLTCPEYTGEGACPLDTTTLVGASEQEAEHDLQSISEPKIVTERAADPSTSDHSDSDFEQKILATVKKRKAFTIANANAIATANAIAIANANANANETETATATATVTATATTSVNASDCPRPVLVLREGKEVDVLVETADHQLKELDEKLVKLLAWQRVQQIAAGEQIAGRWRHASGSTKWAERSVAAIRAPEIARLKALGVLVQPMPSELLECDDREQIASTVWRDTPSTSTAPPPPPQSPQPSHSSHQPQQPPPPPRTPSPTTELRDAFIRASLVRVATPIGSKFSELVDPIPMRRASFRVGTLNNCDVVLDGVKCRRVSPSHAIIFHDQVTNHFELLNYSEWGSQVDGVLYACDITPRDTEPPETPEAAAEVRAAALRELVSKRLQAKQRVDGSVIGEPVDVCTCPKKPPNTVGAWEGSALLPHGTLLQFGCYKFVFSISESVTFPQGKKKQKPAI